MKKMIVLAIALMMVTILLLANCKRGPTPEELAEGRYQVFREYAALDKAYIPTLSLTNQGKIEQSQKAMTRLKEVWRVFADKHYPGVPRDPEFRGSLDKIQNAIRAADEIVSSGENLTDAHEELEKVRFILMNLRRGRWGRLGWWDKESKAGKRKYHEVSYNYYIDYLTEFHEPMEAIVLTAKDKTPETLIDADIEKIQEQLAEASKLMTTIENAEFEQSIFDFSDEKTQTMRGYISQEAESLSKLKEALAGKDKGQIIQASMAIKPVFVKLYTMFGDFEGLE